MSSVLKRDTSLQCLTYPTTASALESHMLWNLLKTESLDLFWNQLTGEIPQSVADITTLEVLNLSHSHLVRRVPQGKQFSTFEGDSFAENLGLWGFPVSLHCEHLSSPQLEADGGEEESASTWKVEMFMFGYGCGTLLGLMMGYLMLSTGIPRWLNAIAETGEHMTWTKRKKGYIWQRN